MELKVAVVQFEVKLDSFDESLLRAERFVANAKKSGAEIVCFPEYFLAGFWTGYRDEDSKRFKQVFKKLSAEHQITIIGGTIVEKLNRLKNVNRCYVFKDGKIISHYDKINLFEEAGMQRGSNLPEILDIKKAKIAVTICRDIFHPAIYQTLAKSGVQVVFVPSFWSAGSSSYSSQKPVADSYKLGNLANTVTKTLCLARSLENGIFIVFVNACGTLKQDGEFDILLGKSFVASPISGIVDKTVYLKRETMFISKLDLREVEHAKALYGL